MGRIWIILSALGLIGGCSSIGYGGARQMSDAEICYLARERKETFAVNLLAIDYEMSQRKKMLGFVCPVEKYQVAAQPPGKREGGQREAQDKFGEALLNAVARNPPATSQVPSGSSGMVCNYTREVTSGHNKICYYNCVGSAYAQTIGAAQQCPLTTYR